MPDKQDEYELGIASKIFCWVLVAGASPWILKAVCAYFDYMDWVMEF